MRTRILSLLAAVLTVLAIGAAAGAASAQESAASAGCGTSPSLTSGTHTIQSGGQGRSFILKIPDGYDSSFPHRLVLGLHWWGGTANDVASGGSDGSVYAHYGLEALSNNTAIFVAPQGIDNGWANPGGRDVTFVDDMIELIEGDLCVDQTQRFSLGFSWGGAMSYALACARPAEFRAVAAIAAPGEISGCSGGTQPVAYLGIHGVSDNIPSGRALRDRFVANNGCTPQTPAEPAPGSLTHITTAYSGCQEGYPVVWAAFDGGHQQGPVDGCAGCESGANSWVKATVWTFFTQLDTNPPPPPPPSGGELANVSAGKCLDVPGQSQTNGTGLQIWNCWGGSNQQWTRTSSGQLTVYGGKCLDAEGGATSPGTRAIIWDCHGRANQQRNFSANGSITGVQSGLCLDVSGAGTANGTEVILWTCHGGSNQQWTLN